MRRPISTTKGTWNIFGINLIPSDSIFIKIREAIESNNLTQEHLQKETGHLAPIIIDKVAKTISFQSF